MPKPKLKPIPKFATEAAEREFWATADTTEYFDWTQAGRAVRLVFRSRWPSGGAGAWFCCAPCRIAEPHSYDSGSVAPGSGTT